jgi:hypothetical protein
MLAFSTGSLVCSPFWLLRGALMVSLRPFIIVFANFENFDVFFPSSESMCLSHELFFYSIIVLFLIASILLRWVLSI